MFAIFLVGGLGTRLRPFTCETPKALLPVLNRPFIAYQFDLLKKTPVKDIVLAWGLGHSEWEKHIRKVAGRRFRVHFVTEKKLLGTGGAIRLAFESFQRDKGKPLDGPILVFNGDVFFDVNITKLIHYHFQNQSQATVALTKVDDPSRFGLVIMNKQGKITGFIEKPQFKLRKNFINGGLYVFEPSFIKNIPLNRIVSLEKQTFPAALKKGFRIMGFKSDGYWNDIGTTMTYRDAHKDLMHMHSNWTETKYLRKRGDCFLYIGRRVNIASSVKFEGFVCLGNHVRIGNEAKIVNSVLHDDVVIGQQAVVSNSVLGRGSQVGNNAIVSDDSFLGPRSVLTSHSKI